uniref:Disease resistance protein At4g27190-like leucine-rich repeats domain-containing protein n=1 Tax=Leersia perrieri TaxID=77586 RepID=A0A0D9W2K5_9ORYZ
MGSCMLLYFVIKLCYSQFVTVYLLQIITADNVGVAVEKIIDKLRKTDASRVIYFDGWEGMGASAVLRAVLTRLKSDKIIKSELKFGTIIHIDCSIWKSRREMQRKIAEELEIAWARDLIDGQDEADDINGINESSRDVIDDIGIAINDMLMSRRFLVVFHNGSDNEMTDVANFGLPLYQPYKGNKILWTFRGRFRLNTEIQNRVQDADVFISAKFHTKICGKNELQDQSHWWDILCEEAAEVASNTCSGVAKLHPTTIAKCWLYISKLNCVGRDIMDFNWTSHASNYWVCDEIIQEWEIGDALQQEMWQEWDDPGLYYMMGNTENWISTTHLISSSYGFLTLSSVAETVSSFFLAAQQIETEAEFTMELLEYFFKSKVNRVDFLQNYNDMFQHAENLRVLKLSRCTFRFASPPFICCRRLRFLGLDNCLDLNFDAGEEVQSWKCFHGLWVLDLNYTEWVFSQQMIEEMDNVKELNLKGVNPYNLKNIWKWQHNKISKFSLIKTIDHHFKATKDANDPITFTFSNMEKMEILDLSGNSAMQEFPDLSKATCLKTVTVDGCVELESVNTSDLPASLEEFSIVATSEQYPNAANITTISLRGCCRLKKLVLSGLPKLEELDLSGTMLEKIDLDAMQAEKLNRLVLLGCLRLRAILWSNVQKPQLDELLVNTVGVNLEGKRHKSLSSVQDNDSLFQSHVIVKDSRFLLSLQLFATQKRYVHFCISPVFVNYSKGKGESKQNVVMQCSTEQSRIVHVDRTLAGCIYSDIFDRVVALSAAPVICPCPPLPLESKCKGSCKVEIRSRKELQSNDSNLNIFIDIVHSLKVQDDFWMTSVPGSNWGRIKWCCIERCPNLHSVFKLSDHDQIIAFSWLETFWASCLQTAHYIWNMEFKHANVDSFKKLQYIHLDSCPRLIHVLPLCNNLPSLEIIQILYCTNLIHVFPLNTVDTINFPKLRHIHLHELPNLKGICEAEVMSAPKLETIVIRGCWNLRHLPDVIELREPRPIVDCEKEWWDNLLWDKPQEDGYNQSSLYKRSSAQHYKKALPKGSFLRSLYPNASIPQEEKLPYRIARLE